SASYSSGPLVRGQTRISSSFGSILSVGRSTGGSVDMAKLRRLHRHYSMPRDELLQLRLAFGVFLCEFDLGDRNQDFRACLEIPRLEGPLLFRPAIGRHHR